MFKILLVEDELVIAEDLKDILEDMGYKVCGIATTSREALAMIEQESPDLAFLDVKIKGAKDGIELAKEINEQYHLPFIMLTSFADQKTINRAKEVNPYAYLVKPFNEKEILAAIELTMDKYNKVHGGKHTPDDLQDFMLKDSLFVRTNGMLLKLKLHDIFYLEADANYSQIHTRDKKIVLRATLKELEGKLEASGFARIHKSFLINLDKIDSIQPESVCVAGKEIPISRNQYAWLLRRIKML